MTKFPISHYGVNYNTTTNLTTVNNATWGHKEETDDINTLVNVSNSFNEPKEEYYEYDKKKYPLIINRDNLEISKQNYYLAMFLEKNNPHIKAYASYFPLNFLVNEVISFLIKNPENGTEIIVRNIMKNSNQYGEKEEEKLTKSRQKKILNNWISHHLLGMTVHDWFLKRIVEIKKNSYSSEKFYTVKSIHHNLDKQLHLKLTFNKHDTPLTVQARKIKMYFFSHVVSDEIPSLMLNKKNNPLLNNEKIRIDSISWGYFHVGMLFSRELNINTSNWSEIDIITLGEYVENLIEEEMVPELFIGYFLLPAQVNRLIEVKGSDIDFALNEVQAVTHDKCVGKYIFDKYFDTLNNKNKGENIFYTLLNDIENYKNRTELAKKTLKEHGLGDDDLTNYMNSHIIFSPLYYNKKLPNLNKLFSDQSEKTAKSFAKVDLFLMELYWDDVKKDKEEKEFISSSEVADYEVSFNNRAALLNMALILGSEDLNIQPNIIKLNAMVDVFSAKRGNECRVYLFIKNDKSGYELKRVDSKLREFTSDFLDKGDKNIPNDNNYELILETLNKKNFNESIDCFFSLLKKKHYNNFLETLNHGYDKTGGEKVLDFLLDIIPFYTCVKESVNGNLKDAVLPCAVDVASAGVTLGTGRLMTIGGRVASSISNSALISIRHALIKKSISSGIKNLVREVAYRPLFAGITKKEMIGVGVDMLRVLDPGVELIACVSKKSLKKIIQLTNVIGDDFSKKIHSSLNKLNDFKFSSNEVKTVVSTKTKEKKYFVPINEEKNMFVSVNPYTGEKFGHKYIKMKSAKMQDKLIKANDVLYNRNRLIQKSKQEAALFMEQDPYYFQNHHPQYNININIIPNLEKFIEPVNYWRWHFGQVITDRTAELLPLVKEGYQSESVYLHYFNTPTHHIPTQYEHLRNNMIFYRSEINKAINDANEALKKIKKHTLFNDDKVLQYAEKNPIKSYISKVLNTNDENIIRESITRLRFHTENIVKYFNNLSNYNNIILATCATRNSPYRYRAECPMGFMLPNDLNKNVVIMVDNFDTAPIPSTHMHITALHEISHTSGTLDFILAPSTRDSGDAGEFMESFNDAINFRNGESIAVDPLFISAYGEKHNVDLAIDINFSSHELSQLMKRDPMLKANIFLENADFLARIISDIAMGRKVDADYRNKRDIKEETLDEDKFEYIKYLLLKIALSSNTQKSSNDGKHFIKC